MSKPHGVTMLLTHSKKKISQVVIALFLTQSGVAMADLGDIEPPYSNDEIQIFAPSDSWPESRWEIDLKGGAGLVESIEVDGGVIDVKGQLTRDPSWVENRFARNVLYVTDIETLEAPLTMHLHGSKGEEGSKWRYGAGVTMFTKNDQGDDRRVNVTLNGGSIAYLFNRTPNLSEEYDELIRETQNADEAIGFHTRILSEVNRFKNNVIYVKGRLEVKNDAYIVADGNLEDAQKDGWNLYLGADASLLFDGMKNQESNETVGGIDIEEGAKAFFAKGSTMVILHPQPEGGSDDNHGGIKVRKLDDGQHFIEAAPGSTIEGLENCVTMVFKNGQVYEVGFQKVEGGWKTSEKVWTVQGYFAPSVSAMFNQISNGTAPSVLESYYKQWIVLDDFAQHVTTLNFMQKQLGTTTAMDRQVMDGALNGIHATRRYETLLPVDVEFLKGQSEGEAVGLDISNNLVGLGYERESDGFAISVNGRYLNHYAGMRIAYDDADVKLENRTFRMNNMIEASSTILTASAYAGTKYDWGYLTGHLSYAGAEDKTRILGMSETVVGAEEISRRALSLGVASTFVKEGEWLDAGLTVGGYMTYFLPVDYTVAINGQDAWQLKESKRLVWTGHVGADVSKLWHPTPKSFLKVNLEGGVRMRAGDTDVTQTMSMGGVESSETTEDLARGEAYASLRFDGKLRDGRFGAGVTQAMGPDGVKHTSAEFHVTFDLE